MTRSKSKHFMNKKDTRETKQKTINKCLHGIIYNFGVLATRVLQCEYNAGILLGYT